MPWPLRRPQPGDPDYNPYSLPPDIGEPSEDPTPDGSGEFADARPPASAPPAPTMLPPRPPAAGPSAPPPVDDAGGAPIAPAAGPPSIPKIPTPMGDQDAALRKLGPGKPGLGRKILAGIAAGAAGVAQAHPRTRMGAGEYGAVSRGIQNLLQPGQPGYGEGSYATQTARWDALAGQERQNTQLGLTEQQRMIENQRAAAADRRADVQLGQQSQTLENQRQQLHQRYLSQADGKVITDPNDPALKDPKVFSGSAEPYTGPGGKTYYFARYAPGYRAGAEALARNTARVQPVDEETAKALGLPVGSSTQRDDEGNYLVDRTVYNTALRAKLSPANTTPNRAVMQSLVDKYSGAPGKRLSDLTPAQQQQVRDEWNTKGLKDPEIERELQGARLADTRTRTAATAANAMVPPAPEPGRRGAPPAPPNVPPRTVSQPPAGAPDAPDAPGDPYADAVWRSVVAPKAPVSGAKPLNPTDPIDQQLIAINQDPFAIDRVPPNILGRVRNRAIQLGVPFPSNTNDPRQRQRLEASNTVDESVDRIVELVKQHPEAIGPIAGRIGKLEGWLGTNLVTDGPTADIEQQLRTHMQALLSQEVQAAVGARPAQGMFDMMKQASLQPQQSGAIFEGAAKAQKNIANINRLSALRTIYGAGGLSRSYQGGRNAPNPAGANTPDPNPNKPPTWVPAGAQTKRNTRTGQWAYSTDGGRTWLTQGN